ncbi:MAG: hypothetical protein L3J84_12740 [Gammaproteobacteria bacterium]|nr:hypothetical protein [Gammaproteobacteria bacterium]
MANTNLTRDEIIKNVISIFIDTLGFLNEDEKLSVDENTDVIKDFNVVDIDSMAFGVALEKFFSIKPTNEEWGQAVRICEIADVIIKKVNEKP